jgi:type VI secretion system protein ImpG
MMNEDGDFIRYYKGELTYLRKMGRLFSERYPKLASRLELSPHECADPHVERLIESFAFLSARIQRRLDSEFPEITASLLGVLYPHLVNPVPPMAMAHFEADPAQRKLASGYTISKNTPLFAQTTEGLTCRFRTCYPVTLWPLEVTGAGFEPKAQFDFLDSASQVAAVLRLRLTAKGASLAELDLHRLRFYINGSSSLVSALYEMLFAHSVGVVILAGEGEPLPLPKEAILPVGFEPDEEVLPYPAHAHPAYRLVQEYFIFPEKFHFFDLDRLQLHSNAQLLDILILLDQAPQERLGVDRHTFYLGCTPVINLFPKTTEPIRLDHRQMEYRLVPDMRRERTMEIHSILSVTASSNPQEGSVSFEPFYSFHHRQDGKEQRAFWHARRAPSGHADRPGTEIFLSFVDLDFKPGLPPTQTVFAHTLCTNRELAVQLPAGALLQLEEAAPIAHVHCFGKPTPPAYPLIGGATLWALISNLSLNHLSLAGGKESLSALKEILRLYGASNRSATWQQIEGIREMACRGVVERVGKNAWRGFCRGTEITLVFEEGMYEGSNVFLLASVLNHFFSLYASLNSFTQLVIRKQGHKEEWKRWPCSAGAQPIV